LRAEDVEQVLLRDGRRDRAGSHLIQKILELFV